MTGIPYPLPAPWTTWSYLQIKGSYTSPWQNYPTHYPPPGQHDPAFKWRDHTPPPTGLPYPLPTPWTTWSCLQIKEPYTSPWQDYPTPYPPPGQHDPAFKSRDHTHPLTDYPTPYLPPGQHDPTFKSRDHTPLHDRITLPLTRPLDNMILPSNQGTIHLPWQDYPTPGQHDPTFKSRDHTPLHDRITLPLDNMILPSNQGTIHLSMTGLPYPLPAPWTNMILPSNQGTIHLPMTGLPYPLPVPWTTWFYHQIKGPYTSPWQDYPTPGQHDPTFKSRDHTPPHDRITLPLDNMILPSNQGTIHLPMTGLSYPWTTWSYLQIKGPYTSPLQNYSTPYPPSGQHDPTIKSRDHTPPHDRITLPLDNMILPSNQGTIHLPMTGLPYPWTTWSYLQIKGPYTSPLQDYPTPYPPSAQHDPTIKSRDHTPPHDRNTLPLTRPLDNMILPSNQGTIHLPMTGLPYPLPAPWTTWFYHQIKGPYTSPWQDYPTPGQHDPTFKSRDHTPPHDRITLPLDNMILPSNQGTIHLPMTGLPYPWTTWSYLQIKGPYTSPLQNYSTPYPPSAQHDPTIKSRDHTPPHDRNTLPLTRPLDNMILPSNQGTIHLPMTGLPYPLPAPWTTWFYHQIKGPYTSPWQDYPTLDNMILPSNQGTIHLPMTGLPYPWTTWSYLQIKGPYTSPWQDYPTPGQHDPTFKSRDHTPLHYRIILPLTRPLDNMILPSNQGTIHLPMTGLPYPWTTWSYLQIKGPYTSPWQDYPTPGQHDPTFKSRDHTPLHYRITLPLTRPLHNMILPSNQGTIHLSMTGIPYPLPAPWTTWSYLQIKEPYTSPWQDYPTPYPPPGQHDPTFKSRDHTPPHDRITLPLDNMILPSNQGISDSSKFSCHCALKCANHFYLYWFHTGFVKDFDVATELGRNLLEMSEVSFLLFHASLHMFDFLESIEHDFIKALVIHTHNQMVT